MKNLAEQMHHLDRENSRRVAYDLPEIQSAKTAEIFNDLFRALRVTFPASVNNFTEQAEFNELRRQWVLAFHENGITSMEQVNAGLRVARRQKSPFLPSPGQFIAWCQEGRSVLDITVSDVMAEYWQWQKRLFRYPSSELYPWRLPVLYHICLELRRQSIDGQLSRAELECAAGEILGSWERRVLSGKPVPPVRRTLVAPKREQGPTPAEMLKAQYHRSKTARDV